MAAPLTTKGKKTIPTPWQERILKRDFEVVLGKMLQPDQDNELETEEPYLRSANVQWEGVDVSDIKMMWFSAREKKELLLRAGDLVVNEGGDVGRCATWTAGLDACYFQNSVNRVRPRQKASTRFLYYWLYNVKHAGFIDAVVSRTTIAHLTAEKLEAMPWPDAPPTDQQRIAAYLDASCASIDAAVAAKRKQLGTLDQVRKSAAHQVLSEGLRPGLPLKDSGIESIGAIPAHWDVKQIRFACEVNYGITLQLEKGQSAGDGVRILTVSNLTIDGNLNLEHEYYIDPAELTKADYLRRGDLLFNWRNGSQYHVGKTAYFDLEGEVAHVSFLLRIRCGRHMDPFFLRSYLGILKDAGFFSGAKDKVNKTFNSSELKRLRVVIPPRDEQTEVCAEIERRTKECNDVKAAIEGQIATLTAYRKSLIHECVTGQRRIAEADITRVKAHG
ncbi:MAG: restriction endonuclease subunit S [Acidobacteriota bacterium]|nr:restriction endonuclease subunit S [Acidobacteriota bacterium]